MQKAIEILKDKKEDIKEIISSPELQEFLIKAIEAFAIGLGKGFAQEAMKREQNGR